MTQEEKIALAAAKNAELLALGREEGTQAAIRWALGTFGRRAALSSSLSLEDQTVTQLMGLPWTREGSSRRLMS